MANWTKGLYMTNNIHKHILWQTPEQRHENKANTLNNETQLPPCVDRRISIWEMDRHIYSVCIWLTHEWSRGCAKRRRRCEKLKKKTKRSIENNRKTQTLVTYGMLRCLLRSQTVSWEWRHELPAHLEGLKVKATHRNLEKRSRNNKSHTL